MDAAPAHPAIIIVLAALCILLIWQASWRLVRLTTRAARELAARFPASQMLARTHPLRAALSRRAPRSYAFMVRRLTPLRFDGLPLTLIVVAALYLIFLLGGLIEDVVEAEEIVGFNEAVNGFFDPYRTPYLVGIFAWITDLGSMPALTLVSFVTTGFLWALQRGFLILPLWVTILGANATTWAGKFGFDMERPQFATSVTAFSPSFPSAHATGSMAVLGFIAYLLARDLRHTRERFEVVFWSLTLIALISFSRVFLSVHHASDIAAGLLIGGFWLLVGFAIAGHSRVRRG
ncbi:MAG: phosphatase PAP2 family protein [Gammaproteobacteria bacterium]